MLSHDQGSALSRRRFLVAGAASAGALAVSAVAGARPAAATTGYSLVVTNRSPQFQDVCLFQKAVDLGVPNAMPLAWLTAPLWPGKSTTFTWSVDYSFVWALTGPLTGGVTFVPWDQVGADQNDPRHDRIALDYSYGTYGFVPTSTGSNPPPGTLEVDVLPTVPEGTASVGIGMSGGSVFAVQAEPGADLRFTPHPQYWVTAGTITAGEVLEIEEIRNEAEIPFDGTFSMQATLDSTNQWMVSPA